MIPAYRVVPINIEDSFGRPFHLYQVEFMDEIQVSREENKV